MPPKQGFSYSGLGVRHADFVPGRDCIAVSPDRQKRKTFAALILSLHDGGDNDALVVVDLDFPRATPKRFRRAAKRLLASQTFSVQIVSAGGDLGKVHVFEVDPITLLCMGSHCGVDLAFAAGS